METIADRLQRVAQAAPASGRRSSTLTPMMLLDDHFAAARSPAR